jgi:acid stress-induced BolA-like protein IbaG/YrbA
LQLFNPTQIKQLIVAHLPCEHITVDGDGQHFFATIVSAKFDGKPRLQRHRLVYEALGDKMKHEIHALSLKTLTPAEWRQSKPAEQTGSRYAE